MQIGALIVAAGMSKRMGEFKPMLSIGSISVAQRVVATLSQAGVSKIVMVTGYNATMLERHLVGNNIIFLRNEQYQSTQMFDSVKIGLEYLKDKCDRVLFCPVDVPLFTAGTVKELINSSAKLACPVCDGITGHPLLISNELFAPILGDSGEGGLRGAVERSGESFVHIPVNDPGTIKDADTPEDFSALLELHNSQLVRPVINVALSKEKTFFDSRIATLLTLVDETNSVRAAGQRMQLSYSSCWNIIRTLEGQLNYSLIERSQGGSQGSSSVLTEQGRLLLERYNAYSKAVRAQAETLYEEYFKDIFDGI
jgi:molybdate transport repressor ModE-like protein